MNEEKLTRRRALAGLGASGFAAAGLGFGGLALATDPAVASRHTMEMEVDGNDLLFEWVETYNGETIEGPTSATPDPPGMVLSQQLGNIAPGDTGALGIRMTLEAPNSDPSVTPYFAFDLHGTAENDTNEPERTAGDDPMSDVGELQEHIKVKIWYDTGLLNIQQLGGDNLVEDSGEDLIDSDAEGTLAEVATNFPDSLTVNNNPDDAAGFPLSPTDGDCLTTDNEVVIALRWEFNDAVNSEDINITQSDSVSFDLHFGAEGDCG